MYIRWNEVHLTDVYHVIEQHMIEKYLIDFKMFTAINKARFLFFSPAGCI